MHADAVCQTMRVGNAVSGEVVQDHARTPRAPEHIPLMHSLVCVRHSLMVRMKSRILVERARH